MGIVISQLLGISVCIAKGIYDEISVDRNSVKIFVNEKEIVSDNFVYNGRTYIPLREVSEQINRYVYWDEKASCARIYGGINFETKKIGSEEFNFNNIELLSEEEEVKEILGSPNYIKHDGYELLISTLNEYDIWIYNGFDLVFDKGRLMEVVINEPDFNTSRDIKVGDDYGKILHKYGYGYYNDIYKRLYYNDEYKPGEYTTTAIVFDIDDNKKISKIHYGLIGY